MTTRHSRSLCCALAFLVLVGITSTASAAVGRTEGHPEISDTGEATYVIPLFAPPGVKGLAPNLSLTYRSRTRNGIFGIGWSVSGLSAIARCNSTIAQDGAAGEVRLNDPLHADRFCLDGNRLRLTSAPGTYGLLNSTYQTEIDTYSRITANETLVTGPKWFRMEGQDGLWYEYGNSADSRLTPTDYSDAHLWALSKIGDRTGNFIQFTYALENGSLRPSTIAYGSNLITFVYDPSVRADPVVEYAGTSGSSSGLVKQVRRATAIEVRSGGTMVRQYLFTYESGTGGISRLKTVTECAATTSDCLSPTTLDWYSGVSGFNQVNGSGSGYPQSNTFVADLNADGREDLLWHSGSSWSYALGQTNGGLGSVLPGPVTASQWSAPIEWDGDGRTDLLYAASNVFYVARFNGSGFDAPFSTGVAYTSTGFSYAVADVDGDDLDDLLKVSTSPYPNANHGKIWARLHRAGGFGAEALAYSQDYAWFYGGFGPSDDFRTSHVRRPDFNGDSRMDVLVRGCFDYEPEFSTCTGSNGWFPFHSYVSPSASVVSVGDIYQAGFLYNSAGGSGERPVLGDFNADGKTDLAYPGAQFWYLYESRGGGQTVVQGPSIAGYASSTARVADYDGDGYSDLFVYNMTNARVEVMRSNAQTLESPVPAGISIDAAWVVGDFAGDGLADFFTNLSGGYTLWNHNSGVAGSFPNALRRATDGFGNYAEFSYAPLSNYGLYSKGSGASYPTEDYQGPLYVVSNVNLNDGIGGSFNLQSFYYEAARVDVFGRGFLGFAYRSWIDSRDGTAQRRTFRQDFPYTGFITNARRTQEPSGNTITQTDRVPGLIQNGSGSDIRFYAFPATVTDKQFEVTPGAYNGVLLKTSVTTNVVDSISGVISDSTRTTTEASTANGLNPGASHTERVYHSSILNDIPNWCIGRPQTTQQINSHTMYEGGAKTRQVNASWNGALCRPEQFQVQPADPQWQVTIDLGYDGYGNVSSETVTGINMPPRPTTIVWAAPGIFPTSISRPVSATFSETTQRTWNYAHGVQLTETDPNGIQVGWQHDSFGRLSREEQPDGTATDFYRNVCDAANGYCGDSRLRQWVQTVQRSTTSAAIREDRLYFDQLDRLAYDEPQQFNGDLGYSIIHYDTFGRVAQRNAPTFASAPQHFWTTYQYDLRSRVTQESRPISDSDPTVQTTHLHYEGATTRIVDPQAKQRSTVSNAVGKTVRSTDALGYYQSFDYDAFGSPVRVSDSAGNTLRTAAFNIRGMRTSSTDTDLGERIDTRNALGEITAQTDANLKTSYFTYDFQSRLTGRQMPEGASDYITSTWTWGQSDTANNVGKLQSTQIVGTAGAGITTYGEAFTYDQLGRPVQTQVTEGANSYFVDTSYNATTGFVDTLTYPTSTSGYRLKLQYDYQYGHLLRVKDFNAPPTVFWQANTANARGQVTDETLGNGLRTTKSFDLVNGWLDFIRTGPGGGTSIQNLSYLFDRVGNLTQRQDGNQSLTESFYYDDLHRLDYSQLNGSPGIDLSYDAYGNILSKVQYPTASNDSYAYSYHPTKVHALTSVTSTGAAVGTYEVTWFASNLPKRIRKTVGQSADSSEFQYAPSGARWHHAYRQGSTLYTHVYIGSLLEKVTEGTNVEWKHYIYADGDPVALYERHSNGTNTTWYMLKDHLGSVDGLADTSGQAFVRHSYDAFGKRRGTNWTGVPPPGDITNMNTSTRRGFTFHEHLDSTGLIHMNGRVYDPLIGRFVSADPYVPDPFNTQDFNRYSYVRNNPLSYTDPSGFSPDDCHPRDIDCGPPPVIPCDFSPFCGRESPWFTPPTYVFTNSLFGLERLQIRRPHMPTVPSRDFPVGNGTLSQQETVFDGMVTAVADMRQRIRDSHLYGFLSNASEEIALSYGHDSIQAKVWDFFGENAVQTVTKTVEGDFTAAGVNLVKAVVKPAKVLSKLGPARNVDASSPAAKGGKPLLGGNPQAGGTRTNTDLPGDRATAKSIFRDQTRGQDVTQATMPNGGVRRTAADGTQIRMNPDGTTRLDLPDRGPLPNGETVHIPPRE